MQKRAHYEPSIHHRRSIRLQQYDYSQSGAYFVTLVTHAREYLFGDVIGLEMQPNPVGNIVQWEWKQLARRFDFLELAAFVLMPNHLHGILIIDRDETDAPVGATRLDPSEQASPALPPLPNKIPCRNAGSPLPPTGPAPGSLGAIVGQFKSRVTKRLSKIPGYAGRPIWQRNYYEHIIRNDEEFIRISNYIESNPSMWAEDEENPSKDDMPA